IDLIDSLQALGVEQDLALPAMAVIGDQSSGKSSVLEALSGVALPRGNDESSCLLYRPLVLKLKQLEHGEEWRGKVTYKKTEVEISDPSQVEGEVNKAQNFIAGNGLMISSKLISLEVSSPNVPDLTLIDLPGITRVAVGNQPADIGFTISFLSLIKTYIQKQETINLVVVPSNVDIATTEALSMAQEVDPEGDRTIGRRVGGNSDVGLLVRTQALDPDGPILVHTQGPTEEGRSDPFISSPHILLEDGKATVPLLAERLTTELISHICKSLPLLENQINKSHQSTIEELQKYGIDIPEDSNKRMFFLIDKINAFNKDITALVKAQETVSGGGSWLFTNLRKEFLNWDNYIEEHFKKKVSIQVFENQKENQYHGRELPGFVNYKTFESIIKNPIKALEELLWSYMVRSAFTKVSLNNFGEFFNLCSTVKKKKKTEKLIQLHIQMEQIVYCQEQVYRRALKEVKEKEAEEEENNFNFQCNSQAPQEDLSTTEMSQHPNAYYEECRRSIGRQVSLIIQYFLLPTFGEDMEKAMLQLLQDKTNCSQLLAERSDITEKRKFLKRRLSRLDQARHKLAIFSY
uniref:MX dynamin-like GTPase 1 n=1 Tax=Peromyscus maniculatus bairdii TaxID=230844 RepID=A0A8C8UG10_PERMB